MRLPRPARRLTPDAIRDNPSVRALALTAGLIPPRPMHSAAEAAALARLAARARRVVELGVFEGSSALVLCDAMAPDAELHLIDPFGDESGWALPAGWRASAAATRRVVDRATRARGGPLVRWWIERSQDAGREWDGGEIDLVFVDGDHSPEGCREDWDVWHPQVRPGGALAFHDARAGQPGGGGGPGPTAVVDELLRGSAPTPGWTIEAEIDTLVVARRAARD